MLRRSPVPAATQPAETPSSTELTRQRDNFKPVVKTRLAQRVGYLCSNPDCQRLTIGPRKGEDAANNVGVAAHIKAASLGGPRYDADQTSEERSSLENGIWLCAVHAHLIDHDEKEFTVEKLKEWKRDAEERAFRQLATGRGPATILGPSEELLQALADLQSLLALPDEGNLEAIRAKVQAGSLAQVEAFEATPRWPVHSVDIDLSVEGLEEIGVLDQARFGQALVSAQRVVLLSAPGTGKTTSLVQIARKMLNDGPVPALVPLGEWAESTKDIFAWLADRHSYAGLSSAHFKFMAHHGELALLLDGWNEVPALARRRLITELTGLEREFPLLNIAMSSRRTSIDVPLSGRRVNILPLTDDQQISIAAAMRGENGVSVLDAAWRTPGLRGLVTIPLYLRALMEMSMSGRLPATSGEVLEGMVGAHEAFPINAEVFHRELSGDHRDYLVALALAAQKAGNSTMSDADARTAVTGAARALVSAGRIGTAPSPILVLDVLVGSHLLVREEGRLYAFQHQQLQEWFASFDLEARFLAAEDLSFEHPLVVETLNDRSWAEIVLFACERMSRKDVASAMAVAKLVDLLLRVDPSFAAQIISRSGPMVWEAAQQNVERFARAWHKAGEIDRAVGFMIASGRPEFADIVWPLVSSDDALSAMRLVRRFNPAVLGDTLDREYLGLGDKARESLVVELAFHGNRDGIDAALRLALTEPETAIRHRVFEGLSFRIATRHLEDLLRGSGPELADAVARRGDIDSVRDRKLHADLIERRKAIVAANTSPEVRLGRLLHDLGDDGGREAVLQELKHPAYSFKDNGSRVLHEAWTIFPQEVAEALTWRVKNGLELPFRPQQYLECAAPTDEKSIAALALDVSEDAQRSTAAFLAGPATVRALVERYLQAHREFRGNSLRTESASRPASILADRLLATRTSVLFDVLSHFAEGLPAEEISDLASVISRHEQGDDGETWQGPPEARSTAIELLSGWGRQLLAQGATRHEMAQLTWAMRRVPDSSQVPILAEMLEAELDAYNAAKTAFEANRADRMALDQIRWPHDHEYRVILTAIGTADAENVLAKHLLDPQFGSEAALGLQVIWQRRNEPRAESKISRWPDFSLAAKNRTRDRSQTSDIAELLISAADKVQAEGGEKAAARAARYAGSAVLLPHGDRAAWFNEILTRDLNVRMRRDFAQRMAVGGLVLPADTLLKGLREEMAEFGNRKWIPDNDLYPVLGWIELLPLSDRPASMLEGLDMIAAKFEFATWRIRDLLASLYFLDEGTRLTLLRGLLTRYPKLTSHYELFQALKNPGDETLDFLLEIASAQHGDSSIDRVARHDYPDELFLTLSPTARDSLPARFAAATHRGAKSFLAKILLASGNHNVFLALAQDEVGRYVIGRFGWSVRSTVIYDRQPTSTGTSSYELIPRDLADLRKGLFALTASSDPETAAFANKFLERLDQDRDEEGGFEVGPRHPDISSGRPWPAVTIDVQQLANEPPAGA